MSVNFITLTIKRIEKKAAQSQDGRQASHPQEGGAPVSNVSWVGLNARMNSCVVGASQTSNIDTDK